MILHATDLTKQYKKSRKQQAFRLHIDDFEVQEGSFTAILGPNGSGKSTFIKLVLNLIYPNEGTIELLGKDHKDKTARTEVGYLPENFSLPENFTVRQTLKNFSAIIPNDAPAFNEQLTELSQAFNVDYLDKRIKDLSKGMHQTAALLLTFMGDKRLYILDEPFNGLDAVQKKAIMHYIFDLQQRQNATILITTHILSDIEKTCDMLHLIKNGTIIDSATKEQINQHFDGVEDYYLNHFETTKTAQA